MQDSTLGQKLFKFCIKNQLTDLTIQMRNEGFLSTYRGFKQYEISRNIKLKKSRFQISLQTIYIMSTDAQLVDLPEQQKPQIKICTPKMFILSILGLYFISKNLYSYITMPVPVNPPPKIEVDQWKQFFQLFDRFQSYVYVTVVGFIVFYFLRKSNDQFQYKQYLKQKEKEEQLEEEQKRKQQERQEKILRKLQEEQKEADLKQQKMAQANQQNNTESQKQKDSLKTKESKKND